MESAVGLALVTRLAQPRGSDGEAAGQPAWMSSALAGAAALAGGGYWLVLRERGLDREERRPASRGYARRFKPGFRRFSLPPR